MKTAILSIFSLFYFAIAALALTVPASEGVSTRIFINYPTGNSASSITTSFINYPTGTAGPSGPFSYPTISGTPGSPSAPGGTPVTTTTGGIPTAVPTGAHGPQQIALNFGGHWVTYMIEPITGPTPPHPTPPRRRRRAQPLPQINSRVVRHNYILA